MSNQPSAQMIFKAVIHTEEASGYPPGRARVRILAANGVRSHRGDSLLLPPS